MSDTAEVEAVEAAPAPVAAAKSGGSMFLLIAGLVGGAAGGIAGAFLVAPRLAHTGSTPPTATAAASTATGGEGKGDGKAIAPGRVYRIDNVIVNPAGSDGTRFLMASVAFEIPDEPSEQLLRAHEVELRDEVISTLGALTMTRLTMPHARDTIKAQLGDLARHILGPQKHVDVYLPQFVLQ